MVWSIGTPQISASVGMMSIVSALNAINKRANLLEATNIRDEAAIDTYTFTREAYLQQRNYLNHDGNPPVTGYDDIFNDDGTDDESGVLMIK